MNIPESLAHVEHNIGRVFETKLIGVEAINSDRQLIHYNQQYHDLRRNDDLAITGDKAIDLMLSIMWYRSRDSQDRPLVKGNMSDLQRDLVSEKALANRGFSHGLDAFIIKNAGHVGRISNRMMATAVEAIIGAVFKDSGFDLEAVRAVMDNLGFFDHPLLLATNCGSLTVHSETALDG